MDAEDAINIAELVDQLREKLALSRNLKTDIRNLDDTFLLKFLRSKEYDVTATSELIVNYFAFRSTNATFFQPIADNKQLITALKDSIFAIAPKYNSTGERVIYFRPGYWNPSKYDSLKMVAISVFIFEYALLDIETQKSGFLEIEDMAGASWRQLMKLSPSVPRLTADLTEKALPVKFSKIHIVNQSRIVDILYSMIKPLLSNQFKQRIAFEGSTFENLQKIFDKEVLPTDVGGQWSLTTTELDDKGIAEINEKVTAYWAKYPVSS